MFQCRPASDVDRDGGLRKQLPRDGSRGATLRGTHTGEFYNPVPPYQIPYGVMLPKITEETKSPDNLLVPVEQGQSVHEIEIALLQRRLHEAHSATIYVSDVLPDSEDFAAVQWWGTLGGFHGVTPAYDPPRPRGDKIMGQYYEAAPGHAADLKRALDPSLESRWRQLAESQGLTVSVTSGKDSTITRGDFIRAAFAARD